MKESSDAYKNGGHVQAEESQKKERLIWTRTCWDVKGIASA